MFEFDLVSMGLASYTVATTIVKLVSWGLTAASILSLIASLSGVGAIGVGVIEFIKREIWKQGAAKMVSW
ncbi:uberolysin/carnocyclin family circular bacteriocin [Paenibacillus mucilaginosus]|uniref:Circular bacteriocin, circularin A/uberolysin family n=1 Tax=Paenibacillus mucilaginosus (strain KNP414) TaxID=1036673 RepID=F8FLY6_PAEMK|nr:uberolysin/carnocyclin family circular bacteriocin [Paenibacillus mucilaginosus]AEI45612.1 hypothetical protein KNP414_07102 [Paenibacillus mucilaginosus KNP414]MCG7215357.1 uberolysin/carnocyclin family circular bacteriocin [Paenibacillus mucilaginosus]WDM27017.1 uberolysin/carnocyclin family circular bacteriocin [Paenibacillus mucilaginosus]